MYLNVFYGLEYNMDYIFSSIYLILLNFLRFLNAASLDVVGIALLWQALFASAFSVSLSWYHRIILTLSVWLVYMGDHLLDIRKKHREGIFTYRHLWVYQNKRKLIVIFALLLFVNLIVAFIFLTEEEFKNGCYVLLLCLGYTFFIARSRKWVVFLKEAFVSLIFVLGVLLFLIFPGGKIAMLQWYVLSFLFFGLLFSNAFLVNCWQKEVEQKQGQYSVTLFISRPENFGIKMVGFFTLLSFIYFIIVKSFISFALIMSYVALFYLTFFTRRALRGKEQWLPLFADSLLIFPCAGIFILSLFLS